MKMLMAIGMLAIAGAAQAGVDNFTPNTGCTGTACTAYINDNPDMTVSYVNPAYATSTGTIVIVTLNGVQFRGPAVFTTTLLSNPDIWHFYYALHYDNNVLTDPLGNTILVTMDVYKSRVLNRSGHNYWITKYSVLNGTVTQ
jgi:hypothetical protein